MPIWSNIGPARGQADFTKWGRIIGPVRLSVLLVTIGNSCWGAGRCGRAIAPAGYRSKVVEGGRRHRANQTSIRTISNETGVKSGGMLTLQITAPSTNRLQRSTRRSKLNRQHDGRRRDRPKASNRIRTPWVPLTRGILNQNPRPVGWTPIPSPLARDVQFSPIRWVKSL